jgi:hypothetical protein
MASPETIVETKQEVKLSLQTLDPENEGLILGERKKHFEGRESSPLSMEIVD